MLSEGPAFLVALVALLIGTAAGFLVQRTAAAIRKNGAWPDVPQWKKFYLSLMGSFAALIGGAFVLMDAPSFSPEDVLARMWLYQTFAAWGAPFILDVGAEIVRERLQKGGRK